MRIYHFSFLKVVCVLFILLSFNVQAASLLRFELSIVDFYNPFLTEAENEAVKKQFISSSTKIIGGYEAKKGWHYQCGSKCIPILEGEWVRDTEDAEQDSQIVAYDTSLQKVIFEVPSHMKSNGLSLKLNYIKVILSSSDGETYTIYVPYQRTKNTHSIKKIYLTKWGLEKPIATEKNFPSLVSHAGISLQINRVNKKPKPEGIAFTQQEKKALFGDNHLSAYGGYVKLNMPKTLQHWQNMGRHDGYGQPTGVWLYDKKRRMEAISLEGRVHYEPNNSFGKYEIWLKINNQLSHVYSNPIHLENSECGVIYGVIFYPDGTEQRYFIPKLGFQESHDYSVMDSKKQLVSQHDLSLLTDFEKSKERYYAAFAEKNGRDWSAKLGACKRLISDAKHILGSSQAELENEYAQYKKLIQDASPKNVIAIGAGYGINDTQVFLSNRPIEGADVKTFEVLNEPCPIVDRPTIECNQQVRENDRYDRTALAKDKNHVYSGEQIFKNGTNIYRRTPMGASEEVDTKSFQLFYIHSGKYYYIDKYRVYRLSAGAIDASFDTKGVVYGPIGSYRFVFLDDNGFFNVEGDRVGLCTEEYYGSHWSGTIGRVIPLSQIPEGISWAVEDDNFEYYLVGQDGKGISYMVDKKTKLQYPLFRGDGNCRKPINQ